MLLFGRRERTGFGYSARWQTSSEQLEDETPSSPGTPYTQLTQARLGNFSAAPNFGRTVSGVSGNSMGGVSSSGISLAQEAFDGHAPHALKRHRQSVQRLAERDSAAFQATGLFNVRKRHETRKPFFRDFYHVILHLHCVQLILVFWTLYICSFLAFAGLWLKISEPCDIGLETYLEAVYFSIESQMNIGYGTNDPNFRGCWEVLWVMPVQSLLGALLDFCMIAMVFQVASRGTNRAATVIFSDTAVLQVSDGEVDFVFRVAEMAGRPLLQAVMQVYCVQHHEDASRPGGFRVEVGALELQEPIADARNGVLFFGLPATVRHHVDRNSPLSPHHTADEAIRAKMRNPEPEQIRKHLRKRPYLEVVVLVSGIEDSSASSVEARHSYTLDDMFWDRMFSPCVSVDENGQHSVDFEAIHETVPALWREVAETDRRIGRGRPMAADAFQLPTDF